MTSRRLGGGSSFDGSQVYRAIEHGEIYRGMPGDEINMAVPVMNSGRVDVCIVIKEIPFESENQYTVKMLETVQQIMSDSVERALMYEKVRGSDASVLTEPDFMEKVSVAEEKKERGMAEYCLCSIDVTSDSVGYVVSALRMTDDVCICCDGKILVLLNNTSKSDFENVADRLRMKGVSLCLH